MTFELPQDIWMCIASAILGQRRFSTPLSPPQADRNDLIHLARLAWTCRSAYFAFRPLLWGHLTLVLHSGNHVVPSIGFRTNEVEAQWSRDPDLVSLLSGLYQGVLHSTLYPTFLPEEDQAHISPGSRRELLSRRIKEVAGAFPFLSPFVVHGGKLHLASLLEQNDAGIPTQPVTRAGITSLWGNASDVAVAVKNGLALIPFPMHLVQSITICELDPSLQITEEDYRRILCDIPSLMSAPTHQVTSLKFLQLSSNDKGSFSLRDALINHYTHAVQRSCALARRAQSAPRPLTPELSSNLRSLALCFTRDIASVTWLEYIASLHYATNLSRLELFGQTPPGVGAAQVEQTLFLGPGSILDLGRLTHLELDFWFQGTSDEPAQLPMATPSRAPLRYLKYLRVSVQLADILFASPSIAPTLFPPIHESNSMTGPAFPQLTWLGLTQTSIVRDAHLVAMEYTARKRPLPAIPYQHMPKLNTLCAPDSDRYSPSSGYWMSSSVLHDLVISLSSLQYLAFPTTGIQLCPDCPPESPSGCPLAVAWPSLKHVDLNWAFADAFTTHVHPVNVTTATFRTAGGFNGLSTLVKWCNLRTVIIPDSYSFVASSWWNHLAKDLPNLQNLTVCETMGKSNSESNVTLATGSTIMFGSSSLAPSPRIVLVYRALTSLTITFKHRGCVSFTDFEFPQLTHLVLDMPHPHLDGFATAPRLKHVTLSSSQLCPRTVSHLLATSFVSDPVIILKQTSPSPDKRATRESRKPTCSTVQSCAPNDIQLRFSSDDAGRRKWRALLGADPFEDWQASRALAIVVGSDLCKEDVDLLVRVVGHLVSKQSRPIQTRAVVDSTSVDKPLGLERLGERLQSM